jgi:hypothetical protein
LVQLSLIGGVAYVAYEIYQDRNPEPQVKPDPSKKTLVVLGKLLLPSRRAACPAPPYCPPF